MLLTAFLFICNYHTFVSVSNAASGNEVVVKGEKVFKDKGCVACHSIGKGKIVGPDLSGVTKRREDEWIKKWIMYPDTMLYTDPSAKELLKVYLVPMPNQGLTGEEADILIEYFKYEDAHNAK